MAWVKSIMSLQEAFLADGLDHNWLWIENESLVQRARNTIAAQFLELPYERLMFIDSDIEFIPDDVAKLYNLDADVACGSYPMKRIGIKSTVWKDGKLLDIDELSGPTEIDFAGTGFLMIKKGVFEKLREQYPERTHRDGKPGVSPITVANKENTRETFSWFDPKVSDGPENLRVYWSEDYSFCKEWREMGGKIVLDPSIKLKHWGTYGFGE